MSTTKNVVQLAIDAAESAIVLGARALCAVTSLTESQRQNVHVDRLYDRAATRGLGVHIENLHVGKDSTEAGPEAEVAGQPPASVVLDSDVLESAEFACRYTADAAQFAAARTHWHEIADVIKAARKWAPAATETH